MSPSRLTRKLSEADREALRTFHSVLERLRGELDAAVEGAARAIPAFEPILEAMDPAMRAQQRDRSRALEQAAIFAGEWGPYLGHLREQGTTYAHMGVEFRDWFALLDAYRRVVSAHVVPEELGGARRALAGMGLFLDIAMSEIGEAYVTTKEALVRSTQEQLDVYTVLFESAPLAMLVYALRDPEDRTTFRLLSQNSAAAEIEPSLRQSGANVPPDITERFAAALESREAESWTVRTAGPDGERWYEARCFPLARRFVGVIFEDVTERHRLERDLARHVRDLERSNRELDDFAYVASHDLKAPLRDIDSLARWIAEDLGDALPEASQRHMGLLHSRIARMERLLDDLLQYSRAGRATVPHEPVDVRLAAENAVATSAPLGFAVVVEGAATVTASRPAIEQIVRNLVDNAAKHHDRDDGKITVRIANGDEGVQLSVADDGPGVPVEFHERVFRMFQTLRPRDEKEGSGMGLAIVKKLAEAQGARVSLESGTAGDGRGTTVRVTWPPAERGGAA